MLHQTLHGLPRNAAPSASLGSDGLLYIRALYRVFRRRLGAFLSASLIVFSVTLIITMQTPPQYTANASIMIDLQQSDVTGIEAALSGLAPDSAAVDTEVEIIKSGALTRKIVDTQNLLDDPEFNTRLQADSTLDVFLREVASMYRALTPHQTAPLAQDAQDRLGHERVIEALQDRLSVRRKGLTYVIDIRVESRSPTKAADLANAFADQYLVEQLEAKFDATSRANDWLFERLGVLREEVRSAESAVEVYRARSGLLSAQGSSLTEQQISELTAQLAVQRAESEEAKARLFTVRSQLDRGLPVDTVGQVLTSNVIRELRSQEAEVTRRRAELSSRYGARHPEILKVERETADIAAQIDQETQRIISSLRSETEVTRTKVLSLEASLNALRTELAGNNQALVRLRELERNAQASRGLYESFLGRFKETGEQESLNEADARIVSPAAIPTRQTTPNTLLNLFLGLVFGVAAGIGVMCLQEAFDSGFTTGEQVETYLAVPYISAVPKLHVGAFGLLKRVSGGALPPPDYLVEKPLSSYTEAYRTLRSSILLSNGEKSPQIVAITSPLPGDGKSSSVFSLGRLSALAGARTLIIDCDLRRRLLSRSLDDTPEHGLVEVLTDQLAWADAITRDALTPCDILPLSKSAQTPADLFGSAAFSSLLESLRSHYDLIILDTAPILPVAETRTLIHKSDATVLVAKWRHTRRDAVKTALGIMSDLDTNLIGVMLNQVDQKARQRFGEGDDAYYYNAYRQYYSG